MSIIVDKNKLYFLIIKGEFKYSNADIVGFKSKNDGNVEITASYTGRDFETMSKIIEESSIINSVTGKPLLRSGIFAKLIILNFFKDIKIQSESFNTDIKVNQDTIGTLHYDFVKHCAMKWLELTNGI